MANVARAEATRSTLVAVARRLFAEQGFAGTSIEDILQAADVSRGALYHHFKNKEDLFRDVYEAVEADLCERIITAAILGEGDHLEMFERGLTAFLDECLVPEVQRVVLLEGPSVLGWDTWHEIDEKYGYGIIKAGIDESMAAGLLEQQSSETLAHVLLGVMIQAGMVVARAPDPKRARRDMAATIVRLVEGLRVN
jgi:AcrR family transcriptional regulator